MKKLILAAVLTAVTATSAMAGTVIRVHTYGGPQGSDVRVNFVNNASSSDMQRCKSTLSRMISDDKKAYNGITVKTESTSGTTTPGSNLKSWEAYDVTVKYPFQGFSTFSCTYFK